MCAQYVIKLISHYWKREYKKKSANAIHLSRHNVRLEQRSIVYFYVINFDRNEVRRAIAAFKCIFHSDFWCHLCTYFQLMPVNKLNVWGKNYCSTHVRFEWNILSILSVAFNFDFYFFKWKSVWDGQFWIFSVMTNHIDTFSWTSHLGWINLNRLNTNQCLYCVSKTVENVKFCEWLHELCIYTFFAAD